MRTNRYGEQLCGRVFFRRWRASKGVERSVRLLPALAFLLILSPPQLWGYDFMERPSSVILSPAPDGFEIAAAGFAQSAYHAYMFENTPVDLFHVEGYAHHALVDAARVRSSVYYATYLLNGPLNNEDFPDTDAGIWLMNALQFEYGLNIAWDIMRGPTRIALLGDYSRRSYHPLHGNLAEPAADMLRAGVGVLGYRPPGIHSLSLDAMARVSWTELYDFWGAKSIPDPRALYTLHTAFEATVATPVPRLSGFLLLMPDLILLRAGGAALDSAVQAGARLGGERGSIELFLDYYHSGDTEQLPDNKSPATLFGYGLRFVLKT